MMATIDRAPPAAALGELRDYLRIEEGPEDALLAGLLRAATETVEAMLGQLLLERDVEERRQLAGGAVMLTAEPVRQLIDAALLAADGTGASLAPGALRLRQAGSGAGRVEVAGVADGSALRLRYRAGLATDWNGVPEALRLAVLRVAAHFHAHRDGGDDAGVPPAVARLLGPWRQRRLR